MPSPSTICDVVPFSFGCQSLAGTRAYVPFRASGRHVVRAQYVDHNLLWYSGGEQPGCVLNPPISEREVRMATFSRVPLAEAQRSVMPPRRAVQEQYRQYIHQLSSEEAGQLELG